MEPTWQKRAMKWLKDHDMVDSILAPEVLASTATLLNAVASTVNGVNTVFACALGPARRFVIELVQADTEIVRQNKQLKKEYRELFREFQKLQQRVNGPIDAHSHQLEKMLDQVAKKRFADNGN